MKLTLKKKEDVAKDTKAFYFEPDKDVDWLPGQYFYFTIPEPKYKDPRGNTHEFSLILSPTESDLIACATRMRKDSNFKKSLDTIKVGESIEGDGPEGTFILDEKEKGEHVLLAGGIGITPFRSFIKYNIDKKTNNKIHLIYANSLPEDITFKDELEDWAKKNENFKLTLTCSRPEESDKKWQGAKGRIDGDMIKKEVENLKKPTFWICGPPPMVDGMEQVLGKLKITSDKIRSEKFSGY